MKNILTFHIESWLGAVYVLLVAAFLVGLFLIAMKNFNSDNEILNASGSSLKTISSVERQAIDSWLVENSKLSTKEVGYRFIIQKYPDKPWLER